MHWIKIKKNKNFSIDVLYTFIPLQTNVFFDTINSVTKIGFSFILLSLALETRAVGQSHPKPTWPAYKEPDIELIYIFFFFLFTDFLLFLK